MTQRVRLRIEFTYDGTQTSSCANSGKKPRLQGGWHNYWTYRSDHVTSIAFEQGQRDRNGRWIELSSNTEAIAAKKENETCVNLLSKHHALAFEVWRSLARPINSAATQA
ncbi:hypothetical protein [Xanthomonas graminis]|uniref:hypothetical protein n=1 Tax=Xanthomonas graminis TaxID=3390026 RepID=UPI001F2201E5|nr:hypothetical protein [Xanthomonas translucens]UKE73370.1 hypothetical protein KFS85_20585 [Xanthomonas translucens pv. phleipratensis]